MFFLFLNSDIYRAQRERELDSLRKQIEQNEQSHDQQIHQMRSKHNQAIEQLQEESDSLRRVSYMCSVLLILNKNKF